MDDEDYERLSQYKWHVTWNGYAARYGWVDGEYRYIRMHREILEAPDGLDVDHINGDRLDNRKSNLRIVTRTQNNYNSKVRRNKASRFKGVYWSKQKRKWHARIFIGGRNIHLGFYDSEEDAARAYNEAAKKYLGEYARINELKEAE